MTFCVVVTALAAGCVPGAPPEYWLDVVNEYRAAAQLPPLSEDPGMSVGAQRHAEYIARTGTIEHREDPNSPYYSPEGQLAASQSDIAKENNVNTSDRDFVEKWVTAPFHAVGILDPRLQVTGYGSFRDAGTPIKAAAALNVIGGMSGSPSPNVVTFPADGATVRLNSVSREYPNPLKGCPGFDFPAGLPLLIQLPTESETVVGASFGRGFQPIELCRYDGHTFTNPDPVAQSVGRDALLARNATVLIPRPVLQPGTYIAYVTTTLRTFSWTFTIS